MNIINSTFQPDFLNNNELELNETIDHLRTILSYGFFNDKSNDFSTSKRDENTATFLNF